MIEPRRLALMGDVSGLTVPPNTLDGRPGLHVLIGRNNSGKTRLLGKIQQSWFQVLVERGMDEGLDKRIGKDRPWPSFVVTWPRDMTDQIQVVLVEAGSFALTAQFVQAVRECVVRRRATLVPTNRHFAVVGSAASGHDLRMLSNIPRIAEQLRKNVSTAEAYKGLVDAFAFATDGLQLDIFGELPELAISVKMGEEPWRSLDICGDGLRDLFLTLLYAHSYPEDDLLIDEPGLRLHPHAQRRLLKFLETTSRKRAVWLATHDGPFIGAPCVRSRYSVARVGDSSHVAKVAGEEIRSEVQALGWLPRDAFLADAVLYCEGPADQVIFEHVLAQIAADSPDAACTVVHDLGGDGALIGSSPGVARAVDLIKSIAPQFAKHVALIDGEGRSPSETQKATERCGVLGLTCYVLPGRELEDYMLEPDLVGHMIRAVASERCLQINVPSTEEIRKTLEAQAGKGALRLNAVWEPLFKRPYEKDKRIAARLAAPQFLELGGSLAKELAKEVRTALGIEGSKLSA